MFNPGDEGVSSQEGWTMFLAHRIAFTKRDRSLFSQTALFCAVGLFASLALVLAYDLPLA
jgi:hypothetical protein